MITFIKQIFFVYNSDFWQNFESKFSIKLKKIIFRNPYLTKSPLTAQIMPRKRPMTRTLSNNPFFTPRKPEHNASFKQNLEQLAPAPTPRPTPQAPPALGNLQIPRNNKSLFSLYRPQTTTRPFLSKPQWTTQKPTSVRNEFASLRNSPFNLKLANQRSNIITTKEGLLHVFGEFFVIFFCWIYFWFLEKTLFFFLNYFFF